LPVDGAGFTAQDFLAESIKLVPDTLFVTGSELHKFSPPTSLFEEGALVFLRFRSFKILLKFLLEKKIKAYPEDKEFTKK